MPNAPVPRVDFGPFREGDLASRAVVAAEIGAACHDIGFFAVTNHGIAAETIDELRALSTEFFDLPEDTKRRYVLEPRHPNRGYNPLGGEALAYAMDEVAPPDLFEAFTSGPIDRPQDEYHTAPAAGLFFVPNLYPDAPPEFERIWNAYYRANEILAGQLMEAFALALGLDPTYFATKIDRHITAQRIIRYPALDIEPEPGQLRIAPHSDYGSLTILLTDGTPGLQLLSLDDEWLDAPAMPDALLINLGDLMADWTNGRWRSTTHRVLPVPLDRPRYSVTFFHHPNYDTLIEPLPTCVSADEPRRHAPVTAGEHLHRKISAQLV